MTDTAIWAHARFTDGVEFAVVTPDVDLRQFNSPGLFIYAQRLEPPHSMRKDVFPGNLQRACRYAQRFGLESSGGKVPDRRWFPVQSAATVTFSDHLPNDRQKSWRHAARHGATHIHVLQTELPRDNDRDHHRECAERRESLLYEINQVLEPTFTMKRWGEQRHIFQVLEFETIPWAAMQGVGGLYLFAAPALDHHGHPDWTPVAIGMTQDFGRQPPPEAEWRQAQHSGATHIHLYYEQESGDDLAKMYALLCEQIQPTQVLPGDAVLH